MAYCKWMEEQPKWLKIVLCIFFLDATWRVYSILKCIYAKNFSVGFVLSILVVVIGFGWWIVDLVCVIINGHVIEFEKIK